MSSILRLFSFILLVSTNIYAITLDNTVKKTLTLNKEVKAIDANNEAYKLYIDEEKAAYYPSLDLKAYVEKIDESTRKQGEDTVPEKRDGTFVQLNLEQVLFEGGEIDAKIDEKKFNYNANKYANTVKLDQIVLNVIKSYIDYVKYDELKKLSSVNLKVQNDYLQTAIENEEISGSSLEKMQVESKISYTKSKLQQQINFFESAQSKLEKYTTQKITTTVCRPEINFSDIPETLEKSYETALFNNLEIKEQKEKVKAQRALIEQQKARFRPRVVARLTQEYDNGLDVKDSRKEETRGRIELNYNLFNGNKDDLGMQRERVFLLENTNILESLEKSVRDKVKTSFQSFNNAKKRIDYLKTYVAKNEEILKIYTEQFEGGTRSFIDILNHENEIYRSKQELIDEEYNLLINYYELLESFGNLTKKISSINQKVCKEITYPYVTRKITMQVKVDDDIEAALEGNDATSELIGDIKEEVVKKIDNSDEVKQMLNQIMDDIYKKKKTKAKAKFVKKVKKDSLKLNIEKKKVSNNDIIETNIPVEYETIQNEFKKDDSSYYTIVIASIRINDEKDLDYFLNKYKIKENSLTYKVGEQREFTRILYGAFATFEDAETVLNGLDPKLLLNKPYISAVKNQKKAYIEYNNL